MKTLTLVEIGYIAGIVDGEGSFQLQKRKARWGRPHEYTDRLSVYNTDLTALEWIKRRVGGSIHKGGTSKLQTKVCWTLQLSGAALRRLLPLITPHLIIKQKQALLLGQFLLRKIRTRPRLRLSDEEAAIRERMCLEMREANHAY